MSSLRRVLTWGRSLAFETQDTVLAAALCPLDLLVFSDLAASNASATERDSIVEVTIFVYAAAGYIALRWRRRAPTVVFAILWLHSMVAILLPAYRPTIGLLLALYTVAAQRGGRTTLIALLAVGITSGFAVAEEVHDVADENLRRDALLVSAMSYAILDISVLGVGRWAGASRRHARSLERKRQAAVHEAVESERARIARELHDIVSHAVTVMVLQAAGAQRMLQTDPPRAGQALVHVEEAGTQAMGELRRLLDVLRVGNAGGYDDEVDLEPQPGLAALDDLVESMRRVGASVRLHHTGKSRRVDRSIDLTAYRVVQEALTNVTKHARPSAATTVSLTWTDVLVVQVSNEGGPKPRQPISTQSAGVGLLGLQERVALVGGQLESGPIPDGGFQVTATLPVTESRATTTSPRNAADSGTRP